MVKIRLSRVGRKNRPAYRIVVLDSRSRRDGRYLERLGWYDPLADEPAKKVVLHRDNYDKWIKKGAKPSETILKLLKHCKIAV